MPKGAYLPPDNLLVPGKVVDISADGTLTWVKFESAGAEHSQFTVCFDTDKLTDEDHILKTFLNWLIDYYAELNTRVAPLKDYAPEVLLDAYRKRLRKFAKLQSFVPPGGEFGPPASPTAVNDAKAWQQPEEEE